MPIVVLIILVIGVATWDWRHGPLQRRIRINIVGSSGNATLGDFPWMVSLVTAGQDPYEGHQCGGTLIAPRWIITSAHCATLFDSPSGLYVLTGTASLIAGGTHHEVSRIVVHESWAGLPDDPHTWQHDIALLKLKDAAVQPPIVMATTDPAPGTIVTVAGWGSAQKWGTISEELQSVDIPIVDEKTCNEPKSYHGLVKADMLCAGETGKDACDRDSGGPLTLLTGGQRQLAGIVSWGEGCGLPDKPGIYTRVTSYAGWIADHMK